MASPQGSHLRWWWPIHYVYIIFLYSFLLSPFLVFFKINENILLHFMLSFLISCTPLPHWVTKTFLGVVRFILMWHFRILKSIMETSCLLIFLDGILLCHFIIFFLLMYIFDGLKIFINTFSQVEWPQGSIMLIQVITLLFFFCWDGDAY